MEEKVEATSSEGVVDEIEDYPGDLEQEESKHTVEDESITVNTSEEVFSFTECDADERCGSNDVDGTPDADYVPSKVTTRDYIYLPQHMEDFEEREEWKTSGKWMLFSHGDMDLLDRFWTVVQPLVQDNSLVCIKSSTATDPVQGVLMCYTTDSGDRRSVKLAADAIRTVTRTDYLMYYKTNEASDCGRYQMHGDSHITKYMHTVAGSLYERDRNNRWEKIAL